MGKILSYGYSKEEDSVKVLLEEALKEHSRRKIEYDAVLSEKSMAPMEIKGFPKKNGYIIPRYKTSLENSPRAHFKRFELGCSRKALDGVEEIMEGISRVIDEYIRDCTSVYEGNRSAIENNKEIQRKVTLLMGSLGIPDRFTQKVVKTSRGSKLIAETKQAGYVSDLKRIVKTTQPSIPNKEQLITSIRVEYDRVRNIVIENSKKEAKRIRESESLHEAALLRAKYTPEDANSSYQDIREAILSKDKYLNLSYWLERNRGDWNYGYAFAEAAIGEFAVDEDNPTDTAIFDDISECISSGQDQGVDGRVFRDTKWNYDKIRTLANSLLSEDLNKLCSIHDFT